jgi:hypothetical protein
MYSIAIFKLPASKFAPSRGRCFKKRKKKKLFRLLIAARSTSARKRKYQLKFPKPAKFYGQKCLLLCTAQIPTRKVLRNIFFWHVGDNDSEQAPWKCLECIQRTMTPKKVQSHEYIAKFDITS